MSKTLKSLSTRYINQLFLRDDYDNSGVLYTNFKRSVILKWLMLFKHSKYCEIESPKKIVENVRISNEEIIDFCKEHPGYKLPISVTTVSKYKLNLLEFVKYLKNHHYDIEYVTKEEYVKENPYKQPFMGFK